MSFYFRPAGNAEWAAFGGYIYIDAKQAIENVDATIETVKFMHEGQLFIRKNGKIYNVIGQQMAQ